MNPNLIIILIVLSPIFCILYHIIIDNIFSPDYYRFKKSSYNPSYYLLEYKSKYAICWEKTNTLWEECGKKSQEELVKEYISRQSVIKELTNNKVNEAYFDKDGNLL